MIWRVLGLLGISLAIVSVAGDAFANPCATVWTGAGDGVSWTDPQNWGDGSCAPDGLADSAVFDGGPGGTVEIDDAGISVSSLVFDSANAYVIASDDDAGFLELDGTAPVIYVASGFHTIDLPAGMAADTTLYLAADAGLTFGLNSPWFGFIGPGGNLTVEGEGTLVNQPDYDESPGVSQQNLFFLSGTFINTGYITSSFGGTIFIDGGVVMNTGHLYYATNAVISGGTVYNVGDQADIGAKGANIVSGGTIYNTDGGCLSCIGESLQMSGGVILNENGGSLAAGEEGALLMDGGFIFNDSTATIGSVGVVQISGGALDNEGQVLVLNAYSFITYGVTLMAPGVLYGNGAFVAVTEDAGTAFPFVNAGTLIPGDGGVAGTITLDDNSTYEQTDGGTLVITIASPSEFGQLVTGASALAGTLRVVVTADAGLAANELPILTASAGLSGAFDSVVTQGIPPAIQASVRYTSGAVLLTLGPVDAGVADAGEDAGIAMDAGSDAGSADAGQDAGRTPDAGSDGGGTPPNDGGTTSQPSSASGCGCGTANAPASVLWLALLMLVGVRRANRTRSAT